MNKFHAFIRNLRSHNVGSRFMIGEKRVGFTFQRALAPLLLNARDLSVALITMIPRLFLSSNCTE